MTSEIYKKIGGNSIYTLIRRAIILPIGLAIVPIIIKFIGVEGYGVWIMIQTLLTYSSVMDMGFSPAMTKYTAEYDGHGDHSKITQIFNTLFVVYVFLCLVLFLIVFVCKGQIVDSLIRPIHIPKETVSFALIISMLVFTFNMIFSVYPSFLSGLQRMDITNKIDSISSIIKFALSLVFLYLGWGIKGLALSGGISCIITLTMYIYASKRIAPYLTFNPFLFNLRTLKEIWGFSIYGAMNNVVAMIHLQLDKLIINYFLGVNSLAFYDIAHRLVSFIWGLCGSFVVPIMPAISKIHASDGIEKSKEVFQTIFKYTSLIVCPVFLFVSVFANTLIVAWLGNGYENAVSVLRVLSLAYMINILCGPVTSVLTGVGSYKISFYGGVVASIATVLFCPILSVKFGILGCAIGILLAFILADTFLFICLQRLFHTSSLPRMLYNSLSFSVIISIIVFSVANVLIGHFSFSRYIGLTLAGISLLIVYGLVICKDRNYRAVWESFSAVRL
ncbi:MAG: Polysacc synt protein [Candidatus Brocadiaceae bacterium]|nr:Polysacc synt protein [Candidatus Brocadiaceae bacterium]